MTVPLSDLLRFRTASWTLLTGDGLVLVEPTPALASWQPRTYGLITECKAADRPAQRAAELERGLAILLIGLAAIVGLKPGGACPCPPR